MNDLFKQLSTRAPAPTARDETETETLADDLGVFGYLRGVRDRALMLELRKKDGSVTALGYSWLERVEFDPSDGLTLRFASQTVRIIGRNLNAEVQPNVRLLAGLVRHRIPWIQEANQQTLLTAAKQATVIERLLLE